MLLHEEGRHARLGGRGPKSKQLGGSARRAQADFR